MDRSDADSVRAGSAVGEKVEITTLASQGEGIGRLADGRVVFVEGAAPGDLVEIDPVANHDRFVRARIGRLVRPGSVRVEPRCPHFGVCGGCSWQHLDYATQLDAKRRIVVDALARIGGLVVDDDVEVVPSPSPYGYRARVRWVESEKGIGYRVRGSRDVCPVEECAVLIEDVQRVLSERVGGRASAGGEKAGDGAKAPGRKAARSKEWIATAGSQGSVLVCETGRRARRGGSPGAVRIEVLGESLRVSGESFVQGNALLWESLASAVVSACMGGRETSRPPCFAELYCGIGFFTVPLARRGAHGLALESDRSALFDLAYNLRRAGLEDRVEVLPGRVEARGDLKERLSTADVVLVDPPRVGLASPVREALAEVRPPRLVYLSCDPSTLARDLRDLAKSGYRPTRLQVFDLFPQTPHVETLVVLEASDPGVRSV